MSSDNLNSIDDKTDPLSSAAKHMDERLRGANQDAVAAVKSAATDTAAIPAITTSTLTTNSPSDLKEMQTSAVSTELKAYLTLLAFPISISLFAGYCRDRDADSV